MLGLLKKDLFRSIINILILIPLVSVYFAMTTDTLSPIMVLMLGALIHIMTIGSVMINEQDEDKHHGYSFLQALPLTAREIVTAKFVLFGLIVAFIAGYANLLFAFFSGPPDWLALSRVFILTNAALSLIITGLIYIGIYRFGYTPFAKWFLAVLLVIGIIPQILFMSFRSTMKNLDIERIIEAIAAVNPLAIIAVGLAIYAGLMQAAIYVRRRENADI